MSKRSPAKNREYSKGISVYQWAGINRSSSLLLLAMLTLVLRAGLSVVQTTHDNRFSFNELQELRAQANQLDVEWGQLLLEQSTFGVEGKIESKAVEYLQMRVPEIASIVMVKDD